MSTRRRGNGHHRGKVSGVPTMITAIVVSGATQGPGVVRSLGRQGVSVTVVSYDKRDIAPSSRFVRQVLRAPHPDKDEAQFVRVLLEAAHRSPGSLLIPASDAALGTVARHKTSLEDAGLIVASDDAEVTETLLDKAKTFALARSAGFGGLVTFAPSNEEDVRRFCESADFPAVLKPELSHIYRELVGVKWMRADSTEEALRAYAVAGRTVEGVLQDLSRAMRVRRRLQLVFLERRAAGRVHLQEGPVLTAQYGITVGRGERADAGGRRRGSPSPPRGEFSGYSCTEFSGTHGMASTR